MNKVTRTIMMRKTKTVLIDMLEEQRQYLQESHIKCDEQVGKIESRDKEIQFWKDEHTFIEGKYKHLKTKHSNLNAKLGRKDREINQLKDAYIDKLELAVDLYERIL